MEPVKTFEHLITNIITIERYLDDESTRQEAEKLINRGINFVAYEKDSKMRFAPSRFIGYIDNSLDKRKAGAGHGNDTDNAIVKIIGFNPLPDTQLHKEFDKYCKWLGFKPSKTGAFGNERKFWLLKNMDEETNVDVDDAEFPEGKHVERKHKARERNSKVVNLAKQQFKKKHNHLFCQACGFDFEAVYGDVGKDFIEAHHIIPVSEMTDNHKTRVEDIAMLCSNCHRMVHKHRPWLSMMELSRLVKASSK